MSTVVLHLRKHFFSITVTTLLSLLIAGSFYRFIILQDYTVAYEGDCDPGSQICFVECETENCDDIYYYSVIERNAAHLYQLCGTDVTACDAAYTCADDSSCVEHFCDPDIDGAEACSEHNTPAL